MAYYIATVKVQDENERGRITNTNEVYCVEAETVTEAEAKVVKEFEGYQMEYHVKSVKESKIIKIRVLKKGDSVSYGRTFVSKKKMVIGVIPIGYADGLPRILSNKGKLFYGKIPCPIIGRISMDLVTVDISHLPGIPEYLCMFSPEYQVDDFAKDCKTISHEVLVNLGERISRVYS